MLIVSGGYKELKNVVTLYPEELTNRITKLLLCIVTSLTLASLLVNFYSLWSGQNQLMGIIHLLDLDQENNLPTWYQSTSLLFCSGMLGMIAFSQKYTGWLSHWRGLSGIFLYLSIDEASSLHETLSLPMKKIIHGGGIFYHAWVFPAIAICLFLLINYWKFLQNLPPRIRNLIIWAGAVYIGGAVGLEIVGGFISTVLGTDKSASIIVESSLEEFLEMLGIVLFLRALLIYAATSIQSVRFVLSDFRNPKAAQITQKVISRS